MYGVGATKNDVTMLRFNIAINKSVLGFAQIGPPVTNIECLEQELSECCPLGLMSLIGYKSEEARFRMMWDQWKPGDKVEINFVVEKGNEQAFIKPIKAILQREKLFPDDGHIDPITDAEWQAVASCFAEEV